MKLSLRLTALLATGIVLVTLVVAWNEAHTDELIHQIDLQQLVWRSALMRVVPQILWIALITIAVVQLAVLRPIARTARWMKDLRVGRPTGPLGSAWGGLLDPISAEAASLAESLVSARASAEAEARLREAADSLWTPERLRVGIQHRLD